MKILISLIAAVLAALLFRAVAPWPVALVLAGVVLLIEVTGQHGQSVRTLLRLDAVVLAWPVAALALGWLGVPGRGVRIAIAAGVAALLAGVAAGRSSGQDDVRYRVLIVAGLISGYALLRALVHADPLALDAAAVATAVPLLVVAQGGVVLPAAHRAVARWAALFAATPAAELLIVHGLRTWL